MEDGASEVKNMTQNLGDLIIVEQWSRVLVPNMRDKHLLLLLLLLLVLVLLNLNCQLLGPSAIPTQDRVNNLTTKSRAPKFLNTRIKPKDY